MKQIQAYDENGEAINNLVQWDQGITIYLNDEQITKAYPVHFQSGASENAYVVNSTYTDDYTISATIPNAALRVASPITGYVYLEDDDTMQSILMFRIGIIARAEPDDLVYEDDEEYYTLSKLVEEYKNVYDYAVDAGYEDDEDAFKAAISCIKQIEFGKVYVYIDSDSDYTEVPVTFSKTFSSAPVVVFFNPYFTYDNFYVRTVSSTTTGATAYCYCNVDSLYGTYLFYAVFEV